MIRSAAWPVIVLLATAGTASTPAWALEVKGASHIEAVTAFPQGAEVTRTAKVTLEAGEHAILLADLPGQAIASSIRVEGKAPGKLEIGSVDVKRTFVTRGDPEVANSARRRLEDEIEALRDQRAEQDNIIKAADAQHAFLDNLAKLPTTPAVPGATGGREDWGQVFAVIGQRSAEAAKAVSAARLLQRAIDKKIADLHKELATTVPKKLERTEVRINATAGAPLEATLTVRYQVGSAGWQAFYDARLATGDKAVAPSLALARRAAVSNNSGEDWDEVALSLSTTRPGRATAAPELNMLSVDFELPLPPPAPVPAAPVAQSAPASGGIASRSLSVRGRAETMAKSAQLDAVSEKAKEERADETAAQATNAAFQAVFAIPGRTTVKAGNEVKRVLVEQVPLDPQLVVRTVPRLDTTAYLYVRTLWPKDRAPALPGQVSLFRDGTFVGNGRLAQLAPGEEAMLGFGADDRVKIKRNVTEDKKGESGTFTTTRVEDRNYTIEAKNLHTRAVQVMVVDRAPVSMHKDVTVDVSFKGPQPTKRDIDGRRGLMQWDLKLEPEEEKTIGFGYRVAYPPDKKVLYRELTPEDVRNQNILRF